MSEQRITREQLNNLRYLAGRLDEGVRFGGGQWDTGPLTGAGFVWLYRKGEPTGEPIFRMRGNEQGYQQAKLERQDQAELIATVMNALPLLIAEAERSVSR